MRSLLLSLTFLCFLSSSALAGKGGGGGMHGGGGGNSYCAEFSDLYESIKEESAHVATPAIHCSPEEEQASVVSFNEKNLTLAWQKWSKLSMHDRIWEASRVLLLQNNNIKAVVDSEVNEFVQKLLNTSPVFLRYKMFESLNGNGIEMQFEKPAVTVQERRIAIGYEAWCWYKKPCTRHEFEPEYARHSPQIIALNYCKLLGYEKLKNARWSAPIEHSKVPGLIAGAGSMKLAMITNGTFNGTFQTHAYGDGYTVILDSVTCER